MALRESSRRPSTLALAAACCAPPDRSCRRRSSRRPVVGHGRRAHKGRWSYCSSGERRRETIYGRSDAPPVSFSRAGLALAVALVFVPNARAADPVAVAYAPHSTSGVAADAQDGRLGWIRGLNGFRKARDYIGVNHTTRLHAPDSSHVGDLAVDTESVLAVSVTCETCDADRTPTVGGPRFPCRSPTRLATSRP